VPFDIADYKRRTGPITFDDLDLTHFTEHPLDEPALRCIGAMHDVEYHTVCYLRDLLVTPAHADPEITAFLGFWNHEEYWHGEALAAVLEAHGRVAGAARVGSLRRGLGVRDRVRPLISLVGSTLAGEDFVALHMTWGALNESCAQASYGQLARRAGDPVLSELLHRIMRQEGRHLDFYASEADQRLARSARARRLTRFALRSFWRPVGSGVIPPAEMDFLSAYLFGDADGRAAMARIDRRMDRFPGLDQLHLVETAVAPLLAA
jgi:hypothetical protein